MRVMQVEEATGWKFVGNPSERQSRWVGLDGLFIEVGIILLSAIVILEVQSLYIDNLCITVYYVQNNGTQVSILHFLVGNVLYLLRIIQIKNTGHEILINNSLYIINNHPTGIRTDAFELRSKHFPIGLPLLSWHHLNLKTKRFIFTLMEHHKLQCQQYSIDFKMINKTKEF